MKKHLLITFFSFLVALTQINAQVTRLGQHESVNNWSAATSYASASEGKKVIEEILDAVGLKANFEIRAANIPNAAAVNYGGKRYILYNSKFFEDLTKKTGTRWAAISVLAHEVGHHLNGHTVGSSGNSQQLELDADEFSGYVLRKMGATVAEAQAAMKTIAGASASRTHPGQYDRLVAIENGWNRADDQLAGRKTTTRHTQTPPPSVRTNTSVASRTPVRTPVSSTTSSKVLGKVVFNADPNTVFYVTSQMNLVKVRNNQVSVIGKLAKINSANYPYVIYDNSTKLFVDRRGNILTQNGKHVGLLEA
ncbi:MAG TPA: hypothetical protein VM368_06690 [Flavisolibacter sp.]|nr:hypothetical protein [Flavisolibacter sp.]